MFTLLYFTSRNQFYLYQSNLHYIDNNHMYYNQFFINYVLPHGRPTENQWKKHSCLQIDKPQMHTRWHLALHWKHSHQSLLPISISIKLSDDLHVGNTPQTSVVGEGEKRWSLVGRAKATEWKKRRGKLKLMLHYSALGGPRWQVGCQSSTSRTFLTVTKTLQTT